MKLIITGGLLRATPLVMSIVTHFSMLQGVGADDVVGNEALTASGDCAS